MLFRFGFRMVSQEMVQYVQQRPQVLTVAPALGRPYVVDDHLADDMCALILVLQILGICDRRHLRHVFMLGNRQNLFFGEVTKSQAILKRYHFPNTELDRVTLSGPKFSLQ